MASLSMQAYALGLTAFMLIKVFASAYFSRQDTKTPVRVGIIAMVANMGLNLLFVVPLHFVWQVGHVGLALATSCSAFLNFYLLFRGLKRAQIFAFGEGWLLFLFRTVAANLAMVLALLVLLSPMFGFEAFENLPWLERSFQLAILVLGGAAAYVLTLLVTGLRAKDLKALA